MSLKKTHYCLGILIGTVLGLALGYTLTEYAIELFNRLLALFLVVE